MKRLLLLVLIVAAAWYGWKHYPELTNRTASHEAVVVNNSGHSLERIRVIVDGQTFVKETLADNERVAFPFKVNRDASFELVWQWSDRVGESHWSGGMVPKGPMVQRHIMTIDGNGEVIYQPETKLGK